MINYINPNASRKTAIVGLLGPAGAGKSSIAGYLEKHYGAKRYSLAAPLKEIARRTLGFSHGQLYGTQEQKETTDPRYGFSCRWFLQKLGTEGCRAVLGQQVWLRALFDRILDEMPPVAVIDDVRFTNEAKTVGGTRGCNRIGDYAGTVWRICPPFDATTATRAQAAGQHASETQWLMAPCELEIAPKERGLEELFRLVEDAARHSGLERIGGGA